MKAVRREIFRAYDIRGIVDQDFDEQWVRCLGRAAGTLFLRRGYERAVVGHDARPSSAGYQEQIVAGLCEAGVDTVFLGMVGTPVLYHAVRRLGMRAGVMITASHNPPQYNGFKLWGGDTTLLPDDIAELYEIMAAAEFSSGAGLATRHDIMPSYMEDLPGGLALPRTVKVVVDGGNGTSGEVTAQMLERCGAEVVRMYCDPDPSFPGHHPDPAVEANMVELMQRVRAEGAAAGFGLDGDGDRIGLVDETGRLWEGDEVAAILAADALVQEPGAVILGDVKCSSRYFKDIERLGGRPVMAATGHSLMKARMLAEGAAFGGELSGHMFFGGRLGGCEDVSWAALKLASLVAAEPDRPLSVRLDHWERTFTTPEIHVDCADGVKFGVVDQVREAYRGEASARGLEIIDIDGVRVVFEDGWALVRCSNTQPVIVLRFEAETEERLAILRDETEHRVREAVTAAGG